ncbi:MAG TPA: arginase family protein [Ilumatobacteraceae bacterium]|nr:arginase family protein [Ilumatobacteraceae bacterium]
MASLGSMFEAGDSGTFLGLSSASADDLGGADIVVIGAPCATPYSSVGPYCKDAPAAIRSASVTYSGIRHHHNFDLGGPMLVDGTDAVDVGDVPWDDTAFEANRAAIRHTCETVLAAGAVPIVLGGDDSIPIPVLQAYASHGPLTIVQIDAHIDWRDEVQGERWGLSSTMRRASEMDHVGEMVQVGRRGVGSARPADLAAAEARGVHFFGAHDVHRSGVQHVLDQVPVGGNVLITVDVDGLDPSLVPGVIGPEPGGLTYFQTIDIIDGVAERATIVGFDVVEFVPERDVNGIGALTTFRLAAHAIGRISRQRANAAATA